MRYEVIVIGAGMVGTSVAWHLQKNNSKVLIGNTTLLYISVKLFILLFH